MRLRVLIVDDEPPARARLRSLLKSAKDIDVVGEAADAGEALQAIRELAPDVVLLDVQMPGQDGFDVLRALTDEEDASPMRCPAIIFVTAHDQYAVQAFETHAVDYLLKPMDQSRLLRALDRARRRLESDTFRETLRTLARESAQEKPLERILIKGGGRVQFVSVATIDFLRADGSYVRVHVGETTHLLRDSLSNLEQRLPQRDFARIHRSAIVNLHRVREVIPESHGDFEVVLKDGQQLSGSRTYASALYDRLT